MTLRFSTLFVKLVRAIQLRAKIELLDSLDNDYVFEERQENVLCKNNCYQQNDATWVIMIKTAIITNRVDFPASPIQFCAHRTYNYMCGQNCKGLSLSYFLKLN